MASGEMSEAEFSNFLEAVLQHLCTHSRDGAIHYICMDWRHIRELLTVGRGRDRVLPSSPPNARGAAVTASRSTPDTSTPRCGDTAHSRRTIPCA